MKLAKLATQYTRKGYRIFLDRHYMCTHHCACIFVGEKSRLMTFPLRSLFRYLWNPWRCNCRLVWRSFKKCQSV